jgi:hypothetical protein
MGSNIGPSEFEGQPNKSNKPGLKPFGGFGLARAWEKLRYAMRTEHDPDIEAADVNAPADKFNKGGVPEHTGEPWYRIQE